MFPKFWMFGSYVGQIFGSLDIFNFLNIETFYLGKYIIQKSRGKHTLGKEPFKVFFVF